MEKYFELKLFFEYYLPIGLLLLIPIGIAFLLLVSSIIDKVSWIIDKFKHKGD